MDSFFYAREGTLDEANASLDDADSLATLVIQVSGQKDEVWGSARLETYKARFPRFHQYVVPEGRIHKDVLGTQARALVSVPGGTDLQEVPTSWRSVPLVTAARFRPSASGPPRARRPGLR
jgi:hypothetical protein